MDDLEGTLVEIEGAISNIEEHPASARRYKELVELMHKADEVIPYEYSRGWTAVFYLAELERFHISVKNGIMRSEWLLTDTETDTCYHWYEYRLPVKGRAFRVDVSGEQGKLLNSVRL